MWKGKEVHSRIWQSGKASCSYTLTVHNWTCPINYYRMLNVREHLSLHFGYVCCSQCFNAASLMSGVLFSYASIRFREFYFCNSKEPRETHVIKLSQKLSILQYLCLIPPAVIGHHFRPHFSSPLSGLLKELLLGWSAGLSWQLVTEDHADRALQTTNKDVLLY